MTRSACRRCLRHARDGGGFQLQTADGPVARCLGCAVRHPPLVRRSGAVALVIGSVLTAINHGDALAGGAWTLALLWKVPLTYAVPFVVATWGALANSRAVWPTATARRTPRDEPPRRSS